MKIPQLRKQTEKKNCHGYSWEDDYSWIHQDNCLEILRDTKKLNPEVRKYLEEENSYTKEIMRDTENLQKKIFKEIEGRIKLDDESLPFKDKKYDYWTKTAKEGNYSKKLRKKIGSDKVECYFDGDLEAKGKKFFSTGDLAVSNNDEFLAFSVDDKGGEYFTIFVRRIADNKIIEKIEDTAGGIVWSYDDKSFFYRKHDSQKRPRQILQPRLGSPSTDDILLFAEIFGDTSLWLQGDKFDSPMNYSFRELMNDYFAHTSISSKEFAEELVGLYTMYSFEALSSCQNLLSSHDVRRFLNRSENNVGALKAAMFMQATFPGVAGIYYGDEIGLNGGDEPSNREAFPWHDESSWDKDLRQWAKDLMNLKSQLTPLKKGKFELIGYSESAVAFRRYFESESLICVINRDSLLKEWKIETDSNEIEFIWGHEEVKYKNNEIVIKNLAPYSGVIFKEIG